MSQSCEENFEQPLADLLRVSLVFQQINKTLESKIGLSLVQWFLLRTLKVMPAVGPLELAKALGITQGTLSQSLRRLSRKELILVCSDPKDARKKIVSLTRSGKQILDSSTAEFKHMFEGLKGLNGPIAEIKTYLKSKNTDLSI
jgi:DNA-binding MarR family transcriptional regulator